MEPSTNVFALLSRILLSCAFLRVDALNFASIDSGGDNFKLQWAYNNERLIFNMTCKTTGWCAVGFTTTADGRRMLNYDIALGGVASNAGYLNGYRSTGFTVPRNDPTSNYNLIRATEENGFTNVQFYWIPATEGDDKDVQIGVNTEVWIVWAWNNNADAQIGLDRSLKHTAKGISTRTYNLFKEAKGNTGSAEGNTGNAKGNTGNAKGNTGNAKANTDNAKGSTGNAKGNTGNAKGDTGSAKGNTGKAKGDTGKAKGNTGNRKAGLPALILAILPLAVARALTSF
ncbi:autotransporter adhesin BpaC-like [Montipora foliosa]|uniref:autotransporter adhesin BpaC-like n=1 Tax=Montipora foliosa TaxID=591990 RepID=UPI0035F1432C